MKNVIGWKRISHKGGFINETTGQTLIIAKKDFGEHYHALLFIQERTTNAEGKKLSPDFATETKAETYAMDWMNKHPKGTIEK